MATTVYNTLEVELLDGSEVILKPLPIKRLRVFMDKIGQIDKIDKDEKDPNMKFFEIITGAAAYALAPQKEGWEENPELAEEVLDTETVYKVLEVCGGINLRDPKLLQAAATAAQGGQS